MLCMVCSFSKLSTSASNSTSGAQKKSFMCPANQTITYPRFYFKGSKSTLPPSVIPSSPFPFYPFSSISILIFSPVPPFFLLDWSRVFS